MANHCQKSTINVLFFFKGLCPAERTGEIVERGIFRWISTGGNLNSSVACPYGSSGSATRFCRCNDRLCKDPYWEEPKVDQCRYRTFNSNTSQELSKLLQVCPPSSSGEHNHYENMSKATTTTT